MTESEAEPESFVLLLSVEELLTRAFSVAVPAEVCRIVTVTVTVDPLETLPKLQPLVEVAQAPDVVFAEARTPVEGTWIARATSVAVDGPLFVTVTVYVEVVPVVVSGDAAAVTARSAAMEERSFTLFDCNVKIPAFVWKANPLLPQRTRRFGLK